ncbi:ribonuclease H-like domain-containing protein [Tanacetum coccineum]
MQKNVLKHQFENFSTASNESLDKAYDRFQKLISQLEVHGAPILKEDINQKFLRSLPSSWNQIALIMRNKPDIDEIDIDDLYNNLRVYEDELKSTNEVSTASGDFGVSTAGGINQVPSTPCAHDIAYSFLAQPTTSPQLENEDFQTGRNMDFKEKRPISLDKSKIECYNCHRKGHFARECRSGRSQGRRSYGDNGRSNAPTNESSSQALVAQDGLGGYDWSNDFEVEPVNYALMAISSSSSSSSSDSENAIKERDELNDKIAKWEESRKNLEEILKSQMSARDKTGLGYSTQLNELSSNHETDSENSLSIFDGRSSDDEHIPKNDRFLKNGYKAVPHPITRNFLTPRADISFAGLDEYAIRNKIIESQITELNNKTSETAGKTNDANTKKPKSVSKSVVSNPKINRDSVIIEDWNSDDEEEVSGVQKVRPETRDDKSGQNSHKQGVGFRKVKACFVYKSTDHLIKECNFHDKKSQESNLKNVVNTGKREGKPVWDNTKRVNHQNFSKYPNLSKTFVPAGVSTRIGLHRPSISTVRPVSTVRPSISIVRPSISTARLVSTIRPSISTARFVCTIRPSISTVRPVYASKSIYPRMDNVRAKGSCSPIKRSYYTKPAFRPKDLKQDVKTFRVKNMTTAGKRAVVNTGKVDHSCSRRLTNPEILLQDHAVVDSGCSSHMTGNKAYLSDYEDYNGIFVAFGSDLTGGKIAGKGKIKTANLDFDDVYFIDELKFNLFFVSQMCDKKNSIPFTESECLILTPSFKLLDESQVLL